MRRPFETESETRLNLKYNETEIIIIYTGVAVYGVVNISFGLVNIINVDWIYLLMVVDPLLQHF